MKKHLQPPRKHVKSTLRFHLVRMSKINKTNDSSGWQGFKEREYLLMADEVQTYTATTEISVTVPQNLKKLEINRSASRSS